jgi:hypothetical protein
MKKSLRKRIRHVFQGVVANGQATGLAASQAPLQQLFGATDLAGFFNGFFKVAIVVGAMLAVIRLGYAGFVYMTTDSFGAKGDARQIIQDAVLGLLLLLSIWLILYQINPNLLNLDILRSVNQVSNPAPSAPAAVPDPRYDGNTPGLTPFEQSDTAPYVAP